jgi:hypothetical protein
MVLMVFLQMKWKCSRDDGNVYIEILGSNEEDSQA